MLSFEQFTKELISTLQSKITYFGGEVTFSVEKENNDVLTPKIGIKRPESNVIPKINLIDLYSLFYDVDYTIDEMASNILASYEKRMSAEKHFDSDRYFDFNEMKSSITMRLVNFEKNVNQLRNRPFIPYLNLAIVFVIHIHESDENDLIQITNDLMAIWHTDTDTLYRLAKENTPCIYQPCFFNFVDRFPSFTTPDSSLDMYVLTNKENYYGVCTLLYEGLLKKVAQEIHTKNLVIIPSSVHECILLPSEFSDKESLLQLTELIMYVNSTNVADYEYLSDYPYIYDAHKDSLNVIS